MSVRIDCTAPKLMPTSLAMLRRSRLLSHITRVCKNLTFSSAVASFERPHHSSSSTLSPPLLNSAAQTDLLYHFNIQSIMHIFYDVIEIDNYVIFSTLQNSHFQFLLHVKSNISKLSRRILITKYVCLHWNIVQVHFLPSN